MKFLLHEHQRSTDCVTLARAVVFLELQLVWNRGRIIIDQNGHGMREHKSRESRGTARATDLATPTVIAYVHVTI